MLLVFPFKNYSYITLKENILRNISLLTKGLGETVYQMTVWWDDPVISTSFFFSVSTLKSEGLPHVNFLENNLSVGIQV